MIKHISHIGIAVADLDAGIAFYEKLGLKLESIEEVPSQKVKVAFFPCGDTRIELLAPTSEDSPVAKYIEKKGEGVQHIAFAVDDLPAELDLPRRQALCQQLSAMRSQVFVTATDPESLRGCWPSSIETRWFHVEQGRVSLSTSP